MLLDQQVDLLIHLGDVGTVEVIDALAVEKPGSDDQIEAHVIFGNTDWDLETLAEYAQDLDVEVDHPVGRLPLGERQLVYCHGDDAAAIENAVAQKVDYLCHGHTHRASDTRRGATRVINPGALFRASAYTVAVLDTDADDVAFLTLPDR